MLKKQFYTKLEQDYLVKKNWKDSKRKSQKINKQLLDKRIKKENYKNHI